MKSSHLLDADGESSTSPRAVRASKRARTSDGGTILQPSVSSSRSKSRANPVATGKSNKPGPPETALASIARHGVRAVTGYQATGNTIVVDTAASLRRNDQAAKQEALERRDRVRRDTRAEKTGQTKLLQQTFQDKLDRLKKLTGNSDPGKERAHPTQPDIIACAKRDILSLLTQESTNTKDTRVLDDGADATSLRESIDTLKLEKASWSKEKEKMEQTLAEAERHMREKDTQIPKDTGTFAIMSGSYKKMKETLRKEAFEAKRVAKDSVKDRDRTIADQKLEMKSLTESEAGLKQQLEALKVSESALQKEVEDARQSNLLLEENLQRQLQTIEQRGAEFVETKRLKGVLSEEKAALAEELDTVKRSNSKLRSKGDDLSMERTKDLQALKDSRASNDDLRRKLNSISDEKVQATREVEVARERQKVLDGKIDSLSKGRDEQQRELESLKTTNAELQGRVQDLAAQNATMTDELAKTKEISNRNIKTLDLQNAALTQELRVSQQAKIESDERIGTLDSQRAALAQEATVLTNQLQTSHQKASELGDKVASMRSQDLLLVEESARLTQDLRSSHAANNMLEDRVKSFDSQMAALEEEKTDLVEKLQSCECAHSVATGRIQQLTEELHHVSLSKGDVETNLEHSATKLSNMEKDTEILLGGKAHLSDFQRHGISIITTSACAVGRERTLLWSCSSFHDFALGRDATTHDLLNHAFRVLLRVNRRLAEPRELLGLWQGLEQIGEDQEHFRYHVLTIVFQISRISLGNELGWTVQARLCTDICHSLLGHLHHDNRCGLINPPEWLDSVKQWQHIARWEAIGDDTEVGLLNLLKQRSTFPDGNDILVFSAEADLGSSEVNMCVELFSNADVLILAGGTGEPSQLIVTRLGNMGIFMFGRRFWVRVSGIGLDAVIWRVSLPDTARMVEWFRHRGKSLDTVPGFLPVDIANWKP